MSIIYDIGDIIIDEKGTEWVVNLLNGNKQLCKMLDYDEFHIREYFIDESQSETIIYNTYKDSEPDIQSKSSKPDIHSKSLKPDIKKKYKAIKKQFHN